MEEHTQSIFGRLMAYRPRRNRTPKEDFFTEAFVSVLEREQNLLRYLFTELTGVGVEKAEIYSQMSFPSKLSEKNIERPDILIRAEDDGGRSHYLLIESKIDSVQNEDQIKGYWEILLDMNCKTKKLIYVTVHAEKVDSPRNTEECRFEKKRWNDIYKILRTAQDSGLCKSTLLLELMQFMREMNMAYEIKLSELTSIVQYPRFLQKAWSMLSASGEESGIMSILVSNKSDRWLSNGVGGGKDIGYTKKSMIDDITICYGIWLDTSDPGDMKLVIDNKELPVGYVALYSWNKGPEKLYEEYKDVLSELENKYWVRPSGSRNCIVRKTLSNLIVKSDDIGPQFVEFFSEGLRELINTPFLSNSEKWFPKISTKAKAEPFPQCLPRRKRSAEKASCAA